MASDMSKSRAIRSRYAAFSLIELAFVTAIIGITCAIVLPHWSNSIQNYQLALAAQRVAADLAWARSCANSSSSSVTVSFNPGAGSYQIQGVPNPDHTGQIYTVNLLGDPYHVTLTSAGFGGATTILFDGYGAPAQGGSVVLSSAGIQRTISLDAVTGRVTIQ